MARGLFVEPFYGGSHKAFADGLARHSAHEIALLTLPGSEWRRRMRSGAQALATAAAGLDGRFDFIIATDMLDLAAFLALARRQFAQTPVLFYLHENQFTYPRIRGTKLNSWFGQMNVLSALVADRVVFNSDYHREDFLAALRTIAKQPNNWLTPEAIRLIEAKSSVLPVGVELEWLDSLAPTNSRSSQGQPPLILWNHRWEFDKAPDVFARGLMRLAAAGIPFHVAIAGDPGINPHPALFELRDALADRVVQFGLLETREAYGRLLWASDIIVSTTRHEFFGVGMVEALYCGCVPLAPARYNYPALVPGPLHTACLWDDEDDFVAKLAALLTGDLPDRGPLRESAARFAWERVGGEWDTAIQALVAGAG